MRLRLRAVGLFALAVVAITCTDAPTSPRDGRNGAMSARHVSMSPSFSAAAAQAYANLAAFGLEVTEVHVHLVAPNGSARDTTIDFPVGQDTLVISIPVDASGTDQVYTALLELRNVDHLVLFSGTQTVVARAASFVTEVPPAIILFYAGPGARTKTVTVGPVDTTVAASATIPTKATAIDTSGAPVTDLVVRWASSDATLAAVSSTGNTTASVTGQGRRGTATISAFTLSGIIGKSRFTFVPPATRIVVASGGGQTGVAGSVLAAPLVVEVQASDLLPVPGVPVTFRAVIAGGAVTTATVITDAVGRASTTLTVGKTAGVYQYEASSGGLPVVVANETATPAPPAAIAIVSGNAQTDSVGRALVAPLVVKVTDQYGGASAGATVTWARVSGAGTVGATTSSTATDGLASTTYTLGNTVGSETISAIVSGVSGSAGMATFTATAISRGAAAIALVSGGGQSGAPGVTLATPLVVRVADALNNPVANATVAWTTPSAGTTFAPASSMTDALGQVSTTVKLGTAAGPVVVSATTAALVATANLTIVPGPAAIIGKVAGDAQTAEVATTVAVAPSAKVTDASGNAIVGAAVVFSVASGGGSVTAASAATDASGVAAVGSWKLGNLVGTNTLIATTGALSTTFSASAKSGSAAKLSFVTAPPTTITVGASIPVISARVTDAFDNAIAQAGTVVTATGTVTPGGGTTTLDATTDATGLATFSLPAYVGPTGTAVLTVSAPGLTSVTSSAITVSAGAPSKLVISTQPSAAASSGALLVTQPVVRVTDAGGNAAGGAGVSVTVAIGSGGGTLDGTQTRVSGVDGLVTFTDLTISGIAGARTLSFTATGLTGALSNTISVGAGAASTMTKNAGDTQSAAAGSTVATAPSVIVKDAAGNPVVGAAVTFSVGVGGGSVTSSAVTTSTSGIATVGAWKLGDAAGANTLTASSGALTATFTATAIAGSAAKLAFVAAPPPSLAVGATVPAITARITDAVNNPVATAGVIVTATAVVTPGGETTPFTATTDATGLATFTPPPYVGVTGTIVLTLTSPGLVSVASSPITVTVGPPAKLVMKTQPSPTATSGTAFVVQPVVQITDTGDNPTTTAGTVVTATIGSGAGTLTGTLTATSAADGSVSFSNLGISGTPGIRILAFNATGLTGITSSAIAIGVGTASTMTKSAGDAQSAAVGSTLAIAPSVVLKDAVGNPVSGVPVAFAVTAGGGGLTTAAVTTDASGIATVGSWTLGNTAGANTLTATSGTLTATFTATGTAGTAGKLVFVATPPAGITVGGTIPSFSARVTDTFGNPVASAGAVVTATGVTSPGGFTTTGTATTDATGLATFTLPAYVGPTGTTVITLSAAGLTSIASTAITISAGAPVKLTITTQPSATTSSGAVIPVQPAVQLSDVGGNSVNVAGVAVTATIATGGGTLGGTVSASTNALGLAVFSNLSISGSPGSRTLQFDAASLTTVVSSAVNVTVGAPALIALNGGSGQTATVGTAVAVAPSVKITDGTGNPVAGVAVTFTAVTVGSTVSNGGAGAATATVNTDASGIAQLTQWTLGTAAGVNTLTATAAVASGSPVTITATGTGGVAAKLVLTTAPSANPIDGVPLAQQPVVTITDALGNLVNATNVITAVATSGSGTLANFTATAVGGVATFSGLTITGSAEDYTLEFRSAPLTPAPSGTITLAAGSFSALSITTQPSAVAQSGVALAQQPVVQLRDVGNNKVSAAGFAINVGILSGGGTVSSAIANTDAAGVAAFSNLTITGAPGPRVLQFYYGGIVVSSATIDLTSGAPATIAVNGGNLQSATAGSTLSIAPSVLVKDGAGFVVVGATVTFSVTGGGGAITGGTATTNALGIASVGSWTLGTVVGVNSLSACTGTGCAVSTSFTATGTVGAASIIETLAGAQTAVLPRTTIPAGTIMFRVKDLANNPVPNIDVTLSGSRADCNFVAGARTNALGIVSVAVITDSMTTGCTMSALASGVELPASAQITTVPYAATHAWFGGAAAGSTAFDLAGNWVNIAAKTNEIPGPGSTPYVPFWPTFNFPITTKNKSFAGLYSDAGAYLDLAGNTLTTSANVNAVVLGGMTIATGSGVTLRGQFDSLTAGVAGSCTNGGPQYVVADSIFVPGKINVACGLVANALFTDGLLTSIPGAFVKIPAKGVLAADSVSFLGDSIVVEANGTAAIGDAQIGGLLRIQNGTLAVTRTSTFSGFGTVDTATVNLVGDVTFTGAGQTGYRFSRGAMYLQGNFAQTNGNGFAFIADSSELTYFIGAAAQSISFAAPGVNRFGAVVSNNLKGVNLLTTVNLASGSSWFAYNGPVSVPAGVTLAIPGFIDFVTGGSMRVDGTVTLATCFKDALVFPFSGTGRVGGISPPIEYSCAYIGGSIIRGGTGSSALRSVPPPAQPVVTPVVVSRPVVVRVRPRLK